MTKLERKKYLSNYYLNFINMIEEIENKNTNIYDITIQGLQLEYGKVQGVDEIIIEFIKRLKTEGMRKIEDEIINNLQNNKRE